MKPIWTPARLKNMSESPNLREDHNPDRVAVSGPDARQGKTGMGVRYVLILSVGAIVVLFALIYLFFFGV